MTGRLHECAYCGKFLKGYAEVTRYGVFCDIRCAGRYATEPHWSAQATHSRPTQQPKGEQ